MVVGRGGLGREGRVGLIRVIGQSVLPLEQGALGGIVRVDAEDDPPDFQLGLGNHAEILDLQGGGGGLGVDVPQREHAGVAQHHSPHGGQLKQGRQAGPLQPQSSDRRLIGDQAPAQIEGGGHRQGHHQHGKPVEQNFTNSRAAEGSCHHGHLGQGEDGHEGLEQVVVDGLRPQPEGEQGGHHGHHGLACPAHDGVEQR